MQKNALPSKESKKIASRAVGRSVSSPSTPRDLWWVRWYGWRFSQHKDQRPSESTLTLNAALYGNPMGRFATIANKRLANGDLNARLWEISCIARKRFWFAVAPMMYAVRKKGKESIGVFRKAIAQKSWTAMTAITQYFVHGSGPQSLKTYMIWANRYN